MTESASTPRLTTGVAGPGDDVELRRLLRENPMKGRMSLSLEREPDFFLGAAVEGENHKAVFVRNEGRLVGLGTRSSRSAWLNSEPGRLGYLSQLRLDRSTRGTGALRAGFKEIRALHDIGDCGVYVTTIIEDNLLARRLLEAQWRGKPRYERRGALSTLVLPLSRPPRCPVDKSLELRSARIEELPEIVECLQRNLRRYQFAPLWTAELLTSSACLGLDIGDFLLAIRGGRIVGVLALWDQQGFKQSVVRGYSGALRFARPLVNLFRPWTGLPRLPRLGSRFSHIYLSHVAVDDDDSGIFLSLLSRAIERATGRGYAYATTGFCEGHPLREVIMSSFPLLEYRSLVYLAHYPQDETLAQRIGPGTPHLEIAVL
jgi:hypothetical protein